MNWLVIAITRENSYFNLGAKLVNGFSDHFFNENAILIPNFSLRKMFFFFAIFVIHIYFAF